MLWVLLSIFASWMLIITVQVNQRAKYSGFLINTYRSSFSFLMLLPFIPFMEFPKDETFYLVCFLTAVISVICMKVTYNLAAKKNGRVANLHQPIVIFLSFMVWLFIDQTQMSFFKNNPVNGILVGLAFLIFIVALQFIRRNDAGWDAFKAVIPIALLYTVLVIATKLILSTGQNMISITLSFVFICNGLMWLCSYPILKSRYFRGLKSIPFNKHFIRDCMLISASHTGSWIFISMAYIMAPNAAYPVAISALAPVWFMLYYWVTKHKDDASPVAGLVMASGAVLLVLAGQ